jgi:hypothetical protein
MFKFFLVTSNPVSVEAQFFAEPDDPFRLRDANGARSAFEILEEAKAAGRDQAWGLVICQPI